MSDDPQKIAEAISKLLPVEKAYDDLAQRPMREAGGALTDLVKAGRLVLMGPIQLLAAYQDRYTRFLERVAGKVPEENRIEVHPQIAGPTLEGLRYADEEDVLTEYMINLLACAMDKTRVQDAHPAFPGLARQLSTDEAMILFHLKKQNYALKEFARYHAETNLFSPRETVANEFPTSALLQPQFFRVYMDHLYHLGLAGIWQRGNQPPTYDADGKQNGVNIESGIQLTPLGHMFVRACVPDTLPVRTGS